jgi:hypothetical protein
MPSDTLNRQSLFQLMHVDCSNDEEMQRHSLQGESKLQIPQHTLEQYHVYVEKYFTKIQVQDWVEPKQKKQRPNNVEAQRTGVVAQVVGDLQEEKRHRN